MSLVATGTSEGWDSLIHALRRCAIATREVFLAERDRWLLWVPVAIGLGIVLYFALPAEPPLWIGAVWTGGAFALVILQRRRSGLVLLGIACAAVGAGLLAAQLRTTLVAAPVLQEEIGPTRVQGRIVEAGAGAGRQRFVLDQVQIAGIAAGATPARVRITVPVSDETPSADRLGPGDWVEMRAALRPPPGPPAPGAWDFARDAWFARIGAVGFSYGAAHRIVSPAGAASDGVSLWLRELRQNIAGRILAARDGETTGIAAALLTGDRSAIPPDVLAAMRDSGLAHLLAISGLHVGLVAGIIFVVLRALMALVEPLAVRYAIKKWAAGAALLGALLYLFLSGASVPTQRAFLMTGLVLLAVVLDRTSLSMRLIAWAAVVLLLLAPESILGPSFQMSFAAATGLVAAFELMRGPMARLAARGALAFRPLGYVAGIALTTLVAGLATTPFAIYHFGRMADYGLAANLAAVPITALWVMPWGLIALLLMPFGAESLALVPMGWGLDAVVSVARAVADLPGAVTHWPAMPAGALALIAIGGLWLCLWRRHWRLAGIVGIAAGLLVMATNRSPDILVDGDARLVAARGVDHDLRLSSLTRAQFTGGVWLRRAGQETADPWPWDDSAGAASAMRCDALGCVQRMHGQTVAFSYDARALAEDCARADVVISLVPIRGGCPSAHTVIDRFDLWRGGAHAIWLDGQDTRVVSVAADRGDRPWSGPRRYRSRR